MPAKSKKQQRFMGMVHATQKGEIEAPSKEVAEVAKSISPTAATEFAETKHKGLPEKKEKEAMRKNALGIFGSMQAKRLANPANATKARGALPGNSGQLSNVQGRTELGQESQMTQRGRTMSPMAARGKFACYVRFLADKAEKAEKKAASECGAPKGKAKKKHKTAGAPASYYRASDKTLSSPGANRLVKLAEQLEGGATFQHAITEVYGDKPLAYRTKIAKGLFKGFHKRLKQAYGEASVLGATRHPSGALSSGTGTTSVTMPVGSGMAQAPPMTGTKAAEQEKEAGPAGALGGLASGAKSMMGLPAAPSVGAAPAPERALRGQSLGRMAARMGNMPSMPGSVLGAVPPKPVPFSAPPSPPPGTGQPPGQTSAVPGYQPPTGPPNREPGMGLGTPPWQQPTPAPPQPGPGPGAVAPQPPMRSVLSKVTTPGPAALAQQPVPDPSMNAAGPPMSPMQADPSQMEMQEQ